MGASQVNDLIKFTSKKFLLSFLGGLFLISILGGCEKDPVEPQATDCIASFREAVRITCAAQLAVMQNAGPNWTEGDVKTLIDSIFAGEGAEGVAFQHIVTTGSNTYYAHYFGSDSVLVEGDPFRVDIGARYHNQCADIARFLPVGGHFNARQRELYQLVLETLVYLETTARPGVHSLTDLWYLAAEYFRKSPLRALDEYGNSWTMDHFFIYFIGHYIGSQVHGEDTGWDRNLPIASGQVFTLEPGLFIPSEMIGVHVEDDYIADADGLERVSHTLPRTIAEIEAIRTTNVVHLQEKVSGVPDVCE